MVITITTPTRVIEFPFGGVATIDQVADAIASAVTDGVAVTIGDFTRRHVLPAELLRTSVVTLEP